MWTPSLNPEVGTTASNVVLLESLAAPTLRLTATPDLVPGDMVEWQGEATVFPNGAFVAKGSFYARYVGSDVWVLQTINGVAPEPEPAAATAYAAPVGGSLSADYGAVDVVTPEPEPEPKPKPVKRKRKGPPPGKGWRK